MTAASQVRARAVVPASTLALVALHLWIARHLLLPQHGPGDQWGYLGSARFLAGDPHTYVMPHFPYFTYGYSIVLAPVERVLDDPQSVFLGIKVVNAVLSSLLLPLLYVFARRVLEATRAHALIAAWMGAVVPAVLAHSSSVLAENLVRTLLVATVLSVWMLVTERPAWQRMLAAPAMVWLHVTHNRFAAALLVFALLLVLVAWRRLAPRWVVVVNGVVALSLLLGAQALRDAIVAARWTYGIETPQGPASEAVDVLTDRHLFGEALLVAVGQAWYLAVGTFGLAAFGIWAIVRRVGRGSGGPALDPTGWRTRLEDPTSVVLGFVVASALAVFATSTYFFTRFVNGSEGFVAGRHNESFVPLWAAAGVVFALSATLRSLRWAAVSLTVVVGLLTAVLLGQRSGDLGSYYTMLNVPALAYRGYAGEGVVHRAALVGLLAVGGVAVISLLRRRPTILLPVAAAWFVVAVSTEVQRTPTPERWDTPAQVRRLDIHRAAAIQTRIGGMPVHYPYYLPDVGFVPWDGTGEAPAPIVFAQLDAPMAERGGRVVLIDEPVPSGLDPPYAVAVWVLPGPEQDRLAAQGALLPRGFPSALPTEARSAELAVDGTPEVTVASGASATVSVRGRHTGRASPWPDQASAGDAGTVRVLARAEAGGPKASAAELPRWVWPGDQFVVDLTLGAVDERDRALPPGRYEVNVDLEQRGFGSFAPAGSAPLRMILEVTR